MLELYHHNISVCAQKVRLALAEKSIAWESREVDLVKGEQLAPSYLAIHPKGVVPALVHDGKAIVELTVILEYLDDAFPTPPLRPTAPADRARMRVWAKVPDDGLHAACGTVSFATAFADRLKQIHGLPALQARLAKLPDRARAERQRQLFERGIDAPFVGEALRYYDKVLADMEKALAAGPWLAGETFSLAECALAPYVLRLDKLGLAAMWTARPRVADWYRRLQARQSWPVAITAFRSRGTGDFDDDLVAQGIDAWPKVKPLLAA